MTSTLQIIFIVLGVLIVVFVWGYNFLQERKLHRAHLKRFQENALEADTDSALSTSEERKIEPKLTTHEPKKRIKKKRKSQIRGLKQFGVLTFANLCLFQNYHFSILMDRRKCRFF